MEATTNTIKDNFSLMSLFATKKTSIYIGRGSFVIQHKTIRDFYADPEWNATYNLWSKTETEIEKELKIKVDTSFDFVCMVIFNLGQYREYSGVANNFKKYLKEIIPNININHKEKQLIVNNITITPEIWNYVIYLLKLSQGEKVSQPQVFSSPEAREFYRQQQMYEEQIQKLKNKNNTTDQDIVLKVFLSIIYSFPSLTIDYLLDQTMAQIHWLHNRAAGEVSYQLNAKLFAAGNMKRGKTPEFFIK